MEETETDISVDVKHHSHGNSNHGDSSPQSVACGGCGGLPWGVLCAVSLSNIMLGFNLFNFGVFYQPLERAFGVSKGVAGWVGSVQMAVIFSVGIFFSEPLKRLGCRQVAVLGGGMIAAGYVLSAAAHHITLVFLTYGLIAGGGVGVVLLSAGVYAQMVFTRRRALLTGITYLGFGVGQLLAPVVSTLLIERFGWRGALMIEGAFLAHTIPLALTFRPVHTALQAKPHPHTVPHPHCEPHPPTQNASHTVPQTSPHTPQCAPNPSPDTPSCRHPTSWSLSLRTYCRGTLDFSLMRNPQFVLFFVGAFLSRCDAINFIHHLPSKVIHDGYSRRQGALILSISQFLWPLRIVVGLAADQPGVSGPLLYLAGVYCTVTGSLIIATATTYAAYISAATIFGFHFYLSHTLQNVVLLELVGVEHIARSQALTYLAIGAGGLFATPASGWLFDVTHNYNLPFYISACVGFCAGLCILAMYVMRRKQQRHLASIPLTWSQPEANVHSPEEEPLNSGDI